MKNIKRKLTAIAIGIATLVGLYHIDKKSQESIAEMAISPLSRIIYKMPHQNTESSPYSYCFLEKDKTICKFKGPENRNEDSYAGTLTDIHPKGPSRGDTLDGVVNHTSGGFRRFGHSIKGIPGFPKVYDLYPSIGSSGASFALLKYLNKTSKSN